MSLPSHLARFADEVWQVATSWSPADQEALSKYYYCLGWQALADPGCPFRGPLQGSLRRVSTRRTPVQLGALAAEMLFLGALYGGPAEAPHAQRRTFRQILQACLVQCPPPDILTRLEDELRALFAHPFDHSLIPVAPLAWVEPPLEYVMYDVLGLFVALPASPARTALALRILQGEFDGGPFDLKRPDIPQDFGPRRSYRIYVRPLRYSMPYLLDILHGAGCLSFELFAASARRIPFLDEASVRVLPGGRPSPFHAAASPACGELVLGYCRELAWACAQDLTEENASLLYSIEGLSGSRFLLQALRLHATGLAGQPRGKGLEFKDRASLAICHLARVAGVEPETAGARQALLAELAAFPAAALKDLLPHARYAQELICEALGWQALLPLVEEIMRLSRVREVCFSFEAGVRNSADPAEGVVDVAVVRAALEQAGEASVRELLGLFATASGAGNALVLVRACCGWDRARVENGLPKRQQLAVKAYGLLPLAGPDETLERYLFFKQYARESTHYGPQRQAHERAAAQTALANLAQVAGYANAVRLEWAMEARRAGRLPQPALAASAGEYALEIAFDGPSPTLTVSRQGHRLKSVPAAVRRDPAYAPIKEALEQLRGQVTRFRATFEELMATGEPLTRADLAGLARLPVARAMLSRLILRSAEGALGLCDPDALALGGLDGALHPIGESALIAHPYHLLAAGELAGWQRHVVTQRIVQPFKQAFRELYVLTPAEREAASESQRFARHTVDGATASRLLQARGWALEKSRYDRTLPCRFFAAPGLWACFEFPCAGFYLGMGEATTGSVVFRPRRWRPSAWQLDPPSVPLADVPPTLFSEVMRDADLVVSVANRDAEARMSAEVFERRGELLMALVSDLGLSGVTVEGHFARIEGSLARYRVHLASGAVHVEPGNYVCIVPAPAQPDERIFLPFADAGEPQLAEIISKVLLLLHDGQITNPRILGQIRAAGGRTGS